MTAPRRPIHRGVANGRWSGTNRPRPSKNRRFEPGQYCDEEASPGDGYYRSATGVAGQHGVFPNNSMSIREIYSERTA